MLNHLGFFFLLFFFISFSKVRVGAKEGGSHYWEMAVAITCGYGGYLLQLLAAHSRFFFLWLDANRFYPYPVRLFHQHLHNRSIVPVPVNLICWRVNTLGPRQNGRHFPDDIFKCIFLNENVWISIMISLMFVLVCPINTFPTLIQIMAWLPLADKPLSEPIMAEFSRR